MNYDNVTETLARWIGGNFTKDASSLSQEHSKESKQLLEDSFADIEGPIWDVHTHLAGIGFFALFRVEIEQERDIQVAACTNIRLNLICTLFGASNSKCS
jgi:hypothetical protein